MSIYAPRPAESIMGIALRELGNESRWTEIRDLNADKFPDMVGTDYYPHMTVIELPDKLTARQKEIAETIAWWRKQEKIRIEGFDIVQTDPMYKRMNARYNERKLKEML